MTETEATDHLEDAQEMLRGASQILQALAASPDCIGGGECLTLAADASMRRSRRWAPKSDNQAAGRHLHAAIDVATMLVYVAT